MFGKLRAFLGLTAAKTDVHKRMYGEIDRDQSGTFRTPQEKKAHTKARAKEKAAKAARKRNRR